MCSSLFYSIIVHIYIFLWVYTMNCLNKLKTVLKIEYQQQQFYSVNINMIFFIWSNNSKRKKSMLLISILTFILCVKITCLNCLFFLFIACSCVFFLCLSLFFFRALNTQIIVSFDFICGLSQTHNQCITFGTVTSLSMIQLKYLFSFVSRLLELS